ncbi:hypothetical protein OTK49_20675 [Vibrio coralliirubri]|uniref:hypothetical protein n=1 Tax=Vibrio coralliirubri TaxID=1516159 RepID=UPI0022843664|nr:hypothetical protein [Vibrio coralliirubri]MCY9864933.1 hypothetical protein [Vibrio coralliirubri]
MSQTRIQIRGVCSICGNLQALKGTALVPHGYDLHWGFQNQACAGTNEVHFGHKNAPKFIQKQIDFLKKEEQELPERIKNTEDRKHKREQETILRRIPSIVAMLEQKIENWKEVDPIEVNIEIEEQELKAKRKAAAVKKAAEAATKKAEKEAKKAEREAKAEKKWKAILAKNYHCIELDNNMIVEWTAEYENRSQLENSHYDKTREYLDEKGITDHYERMSLVYRITHRVRSETATGKQLHKF